MGGVLNGHVAISKKYLLGQKSGAILQTLASLPISNSTDLNKNWAIFLFLSAVLINYCVIGQVNSPRPGLAIRTAPIHTFVRTIDMGGRETVLPEKSSERRIATAHCSLTPIRKTMICGKLGLNHAHQEDG